MFFLLLIIIALTISVVYLSISVAQMQKHNSRPDRMLKEVNRSLALFPYLDPFIARIPEKKFQQFQGTNIPSFKDLKLKIEENMDLHQDYGIYFEALNTGAWFGINERKTFTTASLLKVPVMAAILKKIEDGELSLNTPVAIIKEDLDFDYGPLAFEGVGKTYTIKELLVYETKFSDNTANKALQRQLQPLDFENAVLGMGLLYSSFFKNKENIEYPLSPKEYSNLFRALYYSTYLGRESSNYLLSLLTQKEFQKGLRSGVPPEIPVAHKTGRWYDNNYIHDCGIVYYPLTPYILCVMTQNLTEETAYEKTEEISRIVFKDMREREREREKYPNELNSHVLLSVLELRSPQNFQFWIHGKL